MTDQGQDSCAIRAFVAVAIDDTLRHNLAILQSELKTSGSRVRWVDPDNIHLTLVFLGDIPESMVASLGNELDSVARDNAPCTMEVRGLGFFGRPLSPKVIWAGLRGDVHRVESMQQQVVSGMQAAGCRPDAKPFSPHLTLGRARSARGAGPLIAAIASRNDALFGQLVIQNILLMQSRLTPNGPEYSTLHDARLGEGTDDS